MDTVPLCKGFDGRAVKFLCHGIGLCFLGENNRHQIKINGGDGSDADAGRFDGQDSY